MKFKFQRTDDRKAWSISLTFFGGKHTHQLCFLLAGSRAAGRGCVFATVIVAEPRDDGKIDSICWRQLWLFREPLRLSVSGKNTEGR